MTIRPSSANEPAVRPSRAIPSTNTDIVLTSSVFLLVAHYGDIDAAAEVLHLGAAELHDRIAELEELLAASLLTDAEGRLRPTETGAALLGPLTAAVQAAATVDPRIDDVARALGLPRDETPSAAV